MPWVKIDDHFDDNPKIVNAGPLGMALHVAALCYSNRNLTDGFIPRNQVARLIDTSEIEDETGHEFKPRQLAAKLVTVGLWDVADGGYRIHDYLEFQPSKEQVLAERERKAKAGRKSAAARQSVQHGAEQSVQQDAEESPQDDAQPVPASRSRSPLSVVPDSANGGGEEAKKNRSETLANVTIALGREGFAPQDLTEPLKLLEAELIANPKRIDSPVSWTRTVAEKERDARLAAEQSKEPIRRVFDGENQIDRRDGRGWVRDEEEVTA